ncbi:arabinose transporter [Novosphingobium rosa]|uniref:arabinose transporter n=1 Tax=Novosphingobium rosa TaxID=76978 RepID=UPI00082E72A2|nr:arabinose transporter [Novosphingobium rosa]
MMTSPARHPLAPAFPVMAAVFVGYLVVGMALPVLPLHVHDDLGFGPFVVGLVSGGQFLAALVSRLWAGHLADTRGSRHAVLAGLVAAMGGCGCYLLSLLFTPQPVVAVSIIMVGRILLGGAESLVITGGISWALALLPAQMAGKAIAWVGMAMFAAMAAGSPLGDLVYRHMGFGGIAGSALLLPALATVLVWRQPALVPKARPQGSVGAVLNAVILPGLAFALAGITFGAITSFLTLYFAQAGWAHGALAFTGFASALIAARFVWGDLPDRLGGARTALGCMVVQGIGLVMIALAPQGWIAILGACLCGGGFSLVFPGLGREAVRRAPEDSKGMAMGVYNAFLDVTLGLGSPALGALAGVAGLRSVFLASAVATILAMPFTAIMLRPAAQSPTA